MYTYTLTYLWWYALKSICYSHEEDEIKMVQTAPKNYLINGQNPYPKSYLILYVMHMYVKNGERKKGFRKWFLNMECEMICMYNIIFDAEALSGSAHFE